ncbi:MAG: transglutaminase domain-containing protein [Candidatus Blackburnbacteria bacterium]|nr:transglutaminase domain-containing protein [Candidatus Blackburnbacteria bacterium]
MIFLTCALCTIFFALPRTASAQQEFKTDFATTYIVDQNGDAQVTQEITLTNNFSTVYATSYTLSLEGKKPVNVAAAEGGKGVPVQVDQTDNETKILINFPDTLVGKNKARKFTVTYQIPHLASQNGQVWDLTIPRITSVDDFNTYNLSLTSSKNLGKLAYISPEPKNRFETEKDTTFTFGKDDLLKAGIVAAFGDFQVFSFDLTYHLENPYTDKKGKTSIALVPDTAYQKVYYSKIYPRPSSVALDSDGNWMATYYLKPGEKKDIQVSGNAQIFATPQTLYTPSNPADLPYYLSGTKYWPTDDLQIKSIAQTLGKNPQSIYDYVVKTLSYDYNRVTSSIERLGAKSALASPDKAICMEFTDLFVTLARSSGIPSREVDGFAYTENPQIQPLSLVADVLHAWPEYWDQSLGVWKPIDPTWGKTTGGIDYFNKFDMSHVTFSIHGQYDDSPPPAGSYKLAQSNQRDVSVQFGLLPTLRESVPQITITQNKTLLPFLPNKLHVNIYNPGPVALYNQPIAIIQNNLTTKGDIIKKIDFLAPMTASSFNIQYTLPMLSTNKSSKIQIEVGEHNKTYEFSSTSVQMLQIVSVFTILLLLVGGGFIVNYAFISLKSRRTSK